MSEPLRRRPVEGRSAPGRLLDDGRALLVLRTDGGPDGPDGWFLDTLFCPTPTCHDVHLAPTPAHRTDRGTYVATRDEPKRGTPLAVHVDTGALEVARPGEVDPRLVAELTALLAEEHGWLGRLLRRRDRRAKGASEEAWREADWSWWDPGDLVPYGDLDPDAIDLLVSVEGRLHWAMDHYCIDPRCDCDDVMIVFQEVREGAIEPRGRVRVDLDAWPIARAAADGVVDAIGEAAWEALVVRYPRLHGLLSERVRRARALGPAIYRLAGGYRPVPRPRESEPAAGRNDPCPCGSGRKYKKCCLGSA